MGIAPAPATTAVDRARAVRWLRTRIVLSSLVTLVVGALALLIASTVLFGRASIGGLPTGPTLGIAIGLHLSVRRLRRHLRSLRLVRNDLHLVAVSEVRDNSAGLWSDRATALVRPSVLLDFEDDTNRTYLTRETSWPSRRHTLAVTAPGPYRVVWTGSRAVQLRDQYAPSRLRRLLTVVHK